MNKLPTQFGALKLISHKNVFLVWADDSESIQAFSIRRGLSGGKALRGIGLSIKQLAESPVQFRAVLNIGYAVGNREWKC